MIKTFWEALKFITQLNTSKKILCEIQPLSVRWDSIKEIIFTLKNFGPGNAHNIKLKTFGITYDDKIKDDKIKIDVSLSEAKGPSTLNKDEYKEYVIPWIHFNSEFPFLIECVNVNFKKSKSVWKFNRLTDRSFKLLKKREILKIKFKLFLISIFNKKYLLEYKPKL